MSIQAPQTDTKPCPTYGAPAAVDCPTCGTYAADDYDSAENRAAWCRHFGHGNATARQR